MKNNVNIWIASDHAGYALKEQITASLKLNSLLNIHDLGPFDTTSVDYPDYANLVCANLKNEAEISFGVLICGSGQGMCIRANKFSFIRAALVYSDDSAKLSREHNNANVICLGSRSINLEESLKWIKIFLNTPFAEGRHSLRVAKVGQPTS